MNTGKKVLLVAAGAAGATILSIAGQGALAARNSAEFASSLANKLDVEQGKVTVALDEISDEKKAEIEADMKASYEERLSKAVSGGNITEEQKTKLLARYAETQTKLEDIRKQHEAIMDENEQWAKDNGIDADYLMMGGGKMIKMGPGGGHGTIHFRGR